MPVDLYVQESPGHRAPGHPERPERVRAVADALRGRADVRVVATWPVLDDGVLEATHARAMRDASRDLAAGGGGWHDADTYVTRASWDDARAAAAAVVEAARRAPDGRNAFCAVRPPGHHATGARSMGFCLLNNVALAARAALGGGARRVLVVDHDVHHGNGTQDLFYGSDAVLYQSFHLAPHYPGTGALGETGVGEGAGFTMNAPLPMGAGDVEVGRVFDDVFMPAAQAYRPDLVLVSAGFDSHAADPLGGLRLSSGFFGRLVARLRALGAPVVCALEGGYDLAALAASATAEVEALHGPLRKEPLAPGPPPASGWLGTLLGGLRAVHRSRWGLR